MQKDRSNWTVTKVTFAEAEELDIEYWASKSIKERVSEASNWITEVWNAHESMHGKWESIADGKHIKSEIDEDDF